MNTAYSAALTTSEDTCMGSSSIGAQAVSFGITLGTTGSGMDSGRHQHRHEARIQIGLPFGQSAEFQAGAEVNDARNGAASEKRVQQRPVAMMTTGHHR